MEEAAALGQKLAIQVAGEFACFGDAQHLVQKFGKGFTVLFKLDLDKLRKDNLSLFERYQVSKQEPNAPDNTEIAIVD